MARLGDFVCCPVVGLVYAWMEVGLRGHVWVPVVALFFYVEPVGDVCLAAGRALGCLMVLFLGGRAGMTRSLIMFLAVDLVSP